LSLASRSTTPALFSVSAPSACFACVCRVRVPRSPSHLASLAAAAFLASHSSSLGRCFDGRTDDHRTASSLLRPKRSLCEKEVVSRSSVFAPFAFPLPTSTMASFLQARVFLLVALIALLVSPFFLTSTVSVGIERRAQDVEDCVACRYVWLQVEMDVGNSQIEENIYDSFTQNCIEAQKAPIFYPACQDMFDIIDDMIGDYMDGYTVNQLCENSRMCR